MSFLLCFFHFLHLFGSSWFALNPGENDILCEELLSPSRALRAAMLKSRFADTIVKAQQKALLDHVFV